MPGTGFPRGSTQWGKYAGTFHFPTFSVSDSGGPGGKGAATPLRLVQDAHTSGAAHQATPDITMQPECADEVVETGCGDSGELHEGNLQSNGGGRIGVL